MERRPLLLAAASSLAGAGMLSAGPAGADASGPSLAAYYTLHMALKDGVAWAWNAQERPRRQPDLAGGPWVQVGVSDKACHGLSASGEFWRWTPDAARGQRLLAGVRQFAVGQSGWFAIDAGNRLWQASDRAAQAAGNDAAQACIGDSADYWVGRDGRLWVRGLAHRGQYGDGRLQASATYVSTVEGVVAVRAHTGHAIALRRDGTVIGTGGNRFGPLGRHGLGDKADRWGPIFEGATAIATGSRHSLALRADGTLWAWGEGFSPDASRLAGEVLACAGGDTVTLAWTRAGELVQWERGVEVARHRLG